MIKEEKKQQLLDECTAYFKKSSAFKKLLDGFREKYRSLGHWGGTVVLKNLSRDEKTALGGFLTRDFMDTENVRITALQMEKALKSTRFAELEWYEILERYFEKSLITKKEDRAAKKEARESFFEEILMQYFDTDTGKWLESVLKQRGEGYGLISQHYRENPPDLKERLHTVLRGGNNLPNLNFGESRELLAVFAARITGNPHAFDDGMFEDKLLRIYLQKKTGFQKPSEMPEAEYKKELYYRAGIIKDEVSNDVLVYGIHGWDVNGTIHEGLEGFNIRREPIRLTLQTAANLKRAAGMENRVYIVENPAVFSVLINHYQEKSFICGNGQINLATYIMLDKLAESAELYYAGDYDPEGLLIAQNLKRRYEEALSLWNYETEWYERYRSDVVLKESRLKKLEKITLPELQELKKAMQIEKKAAYQEAMLQEYAIN